jgi:hypothetical protein
MAGGFKNKELNILFKKRTLEEIIEFVFLSMNHMKEICEKEKRAKGVLKEIVEKYSSYLELKGGVAFMQGGMNIQPNIFNIPKVYEMPER